MYSMGKIQVICVYLWKEYEYEKKNYKREVIQGGDGFGVRDSGSNPLWDTNVSVSKTLNP